MRKVINSKIAKEEHNALKSYWSAESRLSQKILISILGHLERQTELLKKLAQKKSTKKPLSAYNKFFGQKIKEGMTPIEIGRLWRKKKE